MDLAPGRVQPLLRGAYGRDLYVHVESCPSTQRLLPADAPHGAVAVAEHQTEGRGRLGREWVDEAGAGLTFSVVLRPGRPLQEWPTLTAVAGEAAAVAVERTAGVRLAVKPPNDLLLDGRKLAGILAEAQQGRIVLGIGVNVTAAPYPGAAALGPGVDRAVLLAELLLRLERAFDAWSEARRATADDAPLVLEVFRAARAAQELPFPPAAHEAEFTGRVLAHETWVVGERAFMALGERTLEYLYVHPAAQGRGVGTALLGLVKALRPGGFELRVFQRLGRTRRFYERHGLELVRLGDGRENVERLPDAVYRWRPTATRPAG